MSLLRNCAIFLLLVTGASALVTIAIRCGTKMAGTVEQNKFLRVLGVLLFLFNFSWFIAGNVWVFGSWSKYNPDVADTTKAPYCYPTTYMFSFVLLIMAWVVALIISLHNKPSQEKFSECLCQTTIMVCLGRSSE